MPQTLGNGVRISLHGVWTNGRPIITVWHILLTSSSLRAQACHEAAGAVLIAWGTHVVPPLANNYSVQRASYVDLQSEDGATGEYVHTTPFTGAQTGSSASPYNGIVVRKSIAARGRGRRVGRVFIPGVAITNITEDGTVSAAARTAAEDALDAFNTAVNTYSSGVVQSMRLVVAHAPSKEVTETKTYRKPDPDGVMASSDIVGFEAATIVSGIKRRVDVD